MYDLSAFKLIIYITSGKGEQNQKTGISKMGCLPSKTQVPAEEKDITSSDWAILRIKQLKARFENETEKLRRESEEATAKAKECIAHGNNITAAYYLKRRKDIDAANTQLVNQMLITSRLQDQIESQQAQANVLGVIKQSNSVLEKVGATMQDLNDAILTNKEHLAEVESVNALFEEDASLSPEDQESLKNELNKLIAEVQLEKKMGKAPSTKALREPVPAVKAANAAQEDSHSQEQVLA